MIGVIAANTYREVMRDRVWFVLLGFGVVLLAASRLLAPIALGEGPRITVDLGLSAVSALGLVVVAVVGAGLVHQEIERRTVHVILARPISRTTYLVGKWTGFTLSLWTTAGLMGVALLAVACWVRGTEVALPLVEALVLVCLSFSVLTALAVLFSSLSTPLLSTLYTLSLYALGWWTADIRAFARTLGGSLQAVLSAASYLLPDLDLFNGRLAVAHAQTIPTLQLELAALYALTYSAAVLALASVAFRSREFK